MKSAAMGVIPFTINPDLRDELEAFGKGGGDINWIEMVRLEKKQNISDQYEQARDATLERPHVSGRRSITWN